MIRRPALLGLVACGLGVALLLVPWLGRERVLFAATPNPPPLFAIAPLPLAPGQEACVGDLVVPSEAEVVRIRPGGAGRLAFSAEAPGGWRWRREVDTPGQSFELDVPLAPPPTDVTATVCVANAGTRALTLGASAESRTRSRTITRVDGRPVEADLTLVLLEREPAALVDRLGLVARRATAFKPAGLAPWAVGLLGLGVLVVVPVGTMWALAASSRR